MLWFITLFLAALVVYLLNYWVDSCFDEWKKCGIPYSKSSSPFKTIFRFLFTNKNLLELMTEDYEKMDGHRFIGCFQLFTPGIMIRDADLVNQICVKDFSYFSDRMLPSEIPDLFTESLGNLTGDKWRTLRHKMTPAFTSGKLKMMFQPIKECCDELLDYIKNNDGLDIEARDFMFKHSINVTGKVSFGLKVDALNEQTEKDNGFLNISKMFFNPSFKSLLKNIISISLPTVRKYIKFSLVDEKIDTFFKKLVKDTIKHREKTGEKRQDFLQLMLEHKRKEQAESQSNSIENKKHVNTLRNHAEEPEDNELLDQLKYMQGENVNYKSSKVFSDDCIASQSFLFISAGSDTIAAALSFILFELAVNPVCQRKLQKEIDEVLVKNGFTYDGVRNMKYMEQIMDETFRLHRIGGFVARICSQNYKIPDSNVVIKKGTMVSLPITSFGHDPQYFPDPKRFDPVRFEDLSAIRPGTFLPFGVGPRMCIAKRLAILEVKMLLAAVLQHFTVVLSPKTKIPLKIKKSSVLQHVEGGIWIKFQRRE